MSTKPIREVLEWVGRGDYDREALDAALEAVRAIEEMARRVVNEGGAYVLRQDGYDRSVDLLESIAKEAP